MKRLLFLLPFLAGSLAFIPTPVPRPWNEEGTDSLGNVVTVHSTGNVHSTIHYDLTKLLALKMGLSHDTAELLARFCALVDQINPKSDYPYPVALNSISIPDTFPSWDESLAGTERGGMNSNAQNELNAQYWHFPFRDPADTLTGDTVWGSYPVTTNFTGYTGQPYFWRVPITYNLKHIMNWALYNGGSAGLPDALTPAEVYYADATSNGYQLVQPNSIQAFGIYLHSLGDSYSHEECMVHDTLRSHPANDPYCGLTYHSEHEFAYDTSMRAKLHADSMFHALWRSLREFKRVHGLTISAVWTADNNGFQDGDGIPDELEDDGDANYQESFMEKWKNPADSDLNGDGVINHSDHTTWRIQACNNEINTLPQPGPISGPHSVCEGSSAFYSIAPVAGATSYSWTLPPGWTGQSDSISISTISGSSSGTISVRAAGPGVISPSRQVSVSVTVIPSQVSLTNINVLFNQSVCTNAKQTIEVAGNNTTYIVRNGGNSTMIAGQKILFYPGFKVVSGGYLHAYVNSGDCCLPLSEPAQNDQAMSAVPFLLPDQPGQARAVNARVYPNPSSGSFRINLESMDGGNPITCEISDIHGRFIKKVSGRYRELPEISMSGMKNGLYYIRISHESGTAVLKLILLN